MAAYSSPASTTHGPLTAVLRPTQDAFVARSLRTVSTRVFPYVILKPVSSTTGTGFRGRSPRATRDRRLLALPPVKETIPRDDLSVPYVGCPCDEPDARRRHARRGDAHAGGQTRLARWTRCSASTSAPAGAETNVAIGLARLGLRVGWCSRLAPIHLIGRFLLSEMQPRRHRLLARRADP